MTYNVFGAHSINPSRSIRNTLDKSFGKKKATVYKFRTVIALQVTMALLRHTVM